MSGVGAWSRFSLWGACGASARARSVLHQVRFTEEVTEYPSTRAKSAPLAAHASRHNGSLACRRCAAGLSRSRTSRNDRVIWDRTPLRRSFEGAPPAPLANTSYPDVSCAEHRNSLPTPRHGSHSRYRWRSTHERSPIHPPGSNDRRSDWYPLVRLRGAHVFQVPTSGALAVASNQSRPAPAR
jgi:hypothetical protein